jgi:hypothetical protein
VQALDNILNMLLAGWLGTAPMHGMVAWLKSLAMLPWASLPLHQQQDPYGFQTHGTKQLHDKKIKYNWRLQQKNKTTCMSEYAAAPNAHKARRALNLTSTVWSSNTFSMLNHFRSSSSPRMWWKWLPSWKKKRCLGSS